MYSFVEGEIIEKNDNRAVIRPDGTGYGLIINISPRTSSEIPPEGQSVRLYTSFRVREEIHQLFGFVTAKERDLFEALLAISGIGGKTALSILDLPRDRIVAAIASGDSVVLTQVSGVGAKTAGRIILELKDKFAKKLTEEWALGGEVALGRASTDEGYRFTEAVEALVELGYNRNDARILVRQAIISLGDDASAENLVRQALSEAV